MRLIDVIDSLNKPLARRILARERITSIDPSICPGCGIDLPRAWHWDGCTRAPKRERTQAY